MKINIFGTQKMLMCTLLGGEGSQKVYGLFTHENVDIFGRPLPKIINEIATHKEIPIPADTRTRSKMGINFA